MARANAKKKKKNLWAVIWEARNSRVIVKSTGWERGQAFNIRNDRTYLEELKSILEKQVLKINGKTLLTTE